MLVTPLARDQHGSPIELPPEAAFWRVRRHTGGRPSTVLGADGEPLFIPINGERNDLRENGCTGSLRLEAVDSDHKSVHAPVAFVELGAADEGASRHVDANPHADLVRTSFEAMTRTMEAMQRAQVERERALAQKERALTDAQVAAQRMNVDLMIALLDRAGGGKPQDPLQVLKQQIAFQKALDAGSRRNSMELPESVDDVVEKEPAKDWLTQLKPLTPVAAVAVQELMVNYFAKGDETKAEAIRKSFSSLGGMLGLGPEAAAVRQAVASAYDAGFASESPTAATENGDERAAPPKPVREVLALLSDDEADAFTEYLDDLDSDNFKRVCVEAAAIAKLEERTAWARELLRKHDVEKATTKTDPVSPTAAPFDVPPALLPILSQLSPTEMQIGASILGVLDRATIQKLADRLLAMPPDQALATIRRTISEAQRRSASVAHRAVASALNTDGANGGAA